MTADRPDDRDHDLPGARLAAISRRAFLSRSLQAGTVAVGLGAVITACGSNGDKKAFSSDSPTTAATGATSTTSAGVDSSTSTTAKIDSNATLEGSSTAVKFTYTPAATGGRVENPYIASWIENESGELVATLAIWFGQDQKGTRFLNELRRWYSVVGSTSVDTVSGATRVPGDYSLNWNGTTWDGKPVAEGNYYVCIEAAREHGPYSLIRQSLTFGADAFTTDLADQGELSAASVAYTPA